MALYTNIKGPVNYTTVGSPTIEDGIVSGFSPSTNYLSLPAFPVKKNIEMVAKINLTQRSVKNAIIGWYMRSIADPSIYRVGDFCINASNKLEVSYIYGGSTKYRSGSYVFNINTDYWVKLIIGENFIKMFYSLDGINYTQDYSNNENTDEFNFINSTTIGDGFGTQPNIYLRGSIDLNETYININGNAWFGTSFSRVKLHSPTAIAYTKKGNPTITSDGVASGFTDKTDYLTLGAFNPGTSKWKFTTKVKIYDYATQISLIDRNSSTRCFQIVVRTTGKFRVNISTNGSSKANEVDGTHVVSVNTIYYICFEYDGSKYYLKYSTDNINWTTDITINNSTKIYPVSSMCMGHSWYNSGTEKWNGEIYLRYTRFEINGVTNDKYKLHALEGDYAIVDSRLVWANPNIYLQSNGTQYIDTGIKPKINTFVDSYVKFSGTFTSGTGRANIFGTSQSDIGTSFTANLGASSNQYNQMFFWVVIYDNKSSRIRSIYNNNYNTKQRISINTDGFVWGNGTQTLQVEQRIDGTQNILLFGANYTGSSSVPDGPNLFRACNLFIYSYFKIYENSTLVRHFVPVPTGMVIGDFTVPSNGMFDIVEQKFYPNQGTGTFTYGKDE